MRRIRQRRDMQLQPPEFCRTRRLPSRTLQSSVNKQELAIRLARLAVLDNNEKLERQRGGGAETPPTDRIPACVASASQEPKQTQGQRQFVEKLCVVVRVLLSAILGSSNAEKEGLNNIILKEAFVPRK